MNIDKPAEQPQDNLNNVLKNLLEDLSEEEKNELIPKISDLIKSAKEDRYWTNYQKNLTKDLIKQTQNNELILRFAQEGPVDNNILQDPNIIKIEAGGTTDSLKDITNLIFEHRLIPNRPLVPHTLQQIFFEATNRFEEFAQRIKNKKIALGDIDLGGALAYWLIKKIQNNEKINPYKKLIDLVSTYDLQGRIAIYPITEPRNSLFRIAWGIDLAYPSKEEKLAAYLTLFNKLSEKPLDITAEIPWHDKKISENIENLIKFSNQKIDEAITKGGLTENTLLIEDVPYTRAHWDETCIQVARRFDNSKTAVLISQTEVPNRPVILNSSFVFYLAPLGEQMAKEGLPVWYGTGFIGLDSRRLPKDKEFSSLEIQKRIENYISENKENIEGAVEFEVIFDNKEFLEKIAQEALGHLITGYTKSPEYNKITSVYLWNEYGHGLKEGEIHTKINFDEILSLRFLVPKSLKQKTYDYFYKRISEYWDTPLIKITERQVPKKFNKYMEENVDKNSPVKIELSPEQKELIANTTLIIPDNDGEAHLTIEIAKKLGIDVRVSNQAWGARLDQELKTNPDILSSAKKTLIIFEMPSKEIEENLKQQGKLIEIIDHHQYQDDDRSKEESSLEQFLKKFNLTDKQLKDLGFDPRFVKGVAINDKTYIYGLRQAGYSEEEIKKIREYDTRAQFKNKYDEILIRNEELYKNKIIKGDVVIIFSKENDNNSIVCDKIVFDNPQKIPKILDIRKNDKGEIVFIYFSGPTETVKKLKEEAKPSFGGSDKTEKISDFVGWNNPNEQQLKKIQQILKIEL